MQGTEGMAGRSAEVWANWPTAEDKEVLCGDRELHQVVGPVRSYGPTKRRRPSDPAIRDTGQLGKTQGGLHGRDNADTEQASKTAGQTVTILRLRWSFSLPEKAFRNMERRKARKNPGELDWNWKYRNITYGFITYTRKYRNNPGCIWVCIIYTCVCLWKPYSHTHTFPISSKQWHPSSNEHPKPLNLCF